MRFEWDSEKDLINQKKHGGLAFQSAAIVFDDPDSIFRKDRAVAGEQRCRHRDGNGCTAAGGPRLPHGA